VFPIGLSLIKIITQPWFLATGGSRRQTGSRMSGTWNSRSRVIFSKLSIPGNITEINRVRYEPGDVAVIHPRSSSADVESLLSLMGWGNIADLPFAIKSRFLGTYKLRDDILSMLMRILSDQSLPDNLPETATLRTLLTCHVDFNAVPRRSFFQLLQHFVTDDMEREKLDEFLSDEGAVSWSKPSFVIDVFVEKVFRKSCTNTVSL
jgi:sulfite reductase alpha subunit-like flavoprotein